MYEDATTFWAKYTKRERKGEENKAKNWRQLKTPITRENYNGCMIRTFNVCHRMFSGVAYGAGGGHSHYKSAMILDTVLQ